jgi:sulfatase modifying factor 1
MRYSLRNLFCLIGGSAALTACSLFGGGGGKPTAQNPGQVSTATGLTYNDEDGGGFMVKPYQGQPTLPNMAL